VEEQEKIINSPIPYSRTCLPSMVLLNTAPNAPTMAQMGCRFDLEPKQAAQEFCRQAQERLRIANEALGEASGGVEKTGRKREGKIMANLQVGCRTGCRTAWRGSRGFSSSKFQFFIGFNWKFDFH